MTSTRPSRGCGGKASAPAVSLKAGEAKTVSFLPEQYAELRLQNARLGGLYTMGEQNLYTAKLSFDIPTRTRTPPRSHLCTEVTVRIDRQGISAVQINGRNILIRGAAWAPDLLLPLVFQAAGC